MGPHRRLETLEPLPAQSGQVDLAQTRSRETEVRAATSAPALILAHDPPQPPPVRRAFPDARSLEPEFRLVRCHPCARMSIRVLIQDEPGETGARDSGALMSMRGVHRSASTSLNVSTSREP